MSRTAATNASPAGGAAQRPLRVFISAAEPSGDRHAAELIRAMRGEHPQATFWGIAGPAMQAAGCQVVEDFTTRATMLVGAARLAGHAWRLVRRVGRLVRDGRPDLAILVDSPALHLPMAKHIKTAGCRVLYYIAPQLWAWAPWRIRRVRARVDRMAVILPFEEAYFRERGVAAEFVGHPLVSQLAAEPPSAEAVQALRQLGRPIVACLPGSRRHVVQEVLPGQIQVARAIAAAHRNVAFVFSAANQAAAEVIRSALTHESFQHQLRVAANADVLSAADFALCASGTATLEVAWHGVPMVVMYNGSKWGYRVVGRWLIRTTHLSLVNILAGRRIVPEFMPYYTSTDPIAAEALSILASPVRQAAIEADLRAVVESLGTANAARQTARMAVDLAADVRAASPRR
ncbi:MAG: lipid-A-disaccharide synthase [Planctomycetes bacterium]|nr:lipid-A-disaccharide synthase [Planctomycetota bacterium]